MIIADLEHLELIPEKRESPHHSLIGGQGFSVFAPFINLTGVVKAFSTPSVLDIRFSGNVVASDYAYLNVIQSGYVYAFSPV